MVQIYVLKDKYICENCESSHQPAAVHSALRDQHVIEIKFSQS